MCSKWSRVVQVHWVAYYDVGYYIIWFDYFLINPTHLVFKQNFLTLVSILFEHYQIVCLHYKRHNFIMYKNNGRKTPLVVPPVFRFCVTKLYSFCLPFCMQTCPYFSNQKSKEWIRTEPKYAYFSGCTDVMIFIETI